jgi:hypothetical protein
MRNHQYQLSVAPNAETPILHLRPPLFQSTAGGVAESCENRSERVAIQIVTEYSQKIHTGPGPHHISTLSDFGERDYPEEIVRRCYGCATT